MQLLDPVAQAEADACHDPVGAAAGLLDHRVTGADHIGVVAPAALQPVGTRAAIQQIAARTAQQRVPPRAAKQAIVPGTTLQPVVAGGTVK